ncbi:uncharacterized protein [Narcine bancroftii]|uniref:uncharacterized protein isoform X5 n=1 Tax=Narcine bancroftii TaxID=1343680 RepID=UPI0038322B0F
MREEAEPATDAARLLGGLLCETLPAGISQWKFHSCEVRRVWFHHCAWIQYINRFHEYFSWEVPEYWYLAGVIRHHGNGTRASEPLCRWENRSASGSSRNPVFACSEGQSLMVWVPDVRGQRKSPPLSPKRKSDGLGNGKNGRSGKNGNGKSSSTLEMNSPSGLESQG